MRFERALRQLGTACLLAVAFLVIAASSSAAQPRWVQATPFGGPMVALAQAPSAPRILYAAGQNGRVYRSPDGGTTWHLRGGSPEGDSIVDIAVDSSDAATVYARGGDGWRFFRTRDGGLTWSRIAPELDTIHSLAAGGNHPGVLFAGTPEGLYRSDDDGDSWAPVAFFENSFVVGVTFDPRAPDTIFVVVLGSPSRVWKSTDRGTTWTSSDLPEASYSRLPHFVFDPVRPGVLYIFFTEFLSTESVIRSGDGGASWSALPAESIRGLAVAPDGTLFAATEDGLERSSDGGTTWGGGLPFDALTGVLVSSAAPGELFAAGLVGIWRSGDNAASWATSNHGLLAQGASVIAIPPTGPPAVLAVAGISLFRSGDQGATWTRLHSVLDGPQPYVIETFDPSRPRTLYGIDTGAAFPVVSRNGGRQWSKLHIPFNCDSGGSICDVYLTTVALDRQDPASILAGGSFYFHYQGFGNFLLRSADGGQTWQRLAPVKDIGDLVIDPGQRDTYHAVGCKGLFQSTDAGATWRKTGRGLPRNLCLYERRPILTIDPNDSLRFYVGTLNEGVFTSSDGGATFRAMNRGLETAPVVTLLIDPADSSKLYAGVAGQGVFRWNAVQRRWTPLNRGLPLAQFGGAIALDPRQPSLLYAASPAEGVFRLDLEDSAP